MLIENTRERVLRGLVSLIARIDNCCSCWLEDGDKWCGVAFFGKNRGRKDVSRLSYDWETQRGSKMSPDQRGINNYVVVLRHFNYHILSIK